MRFANSDTGDYMSAMNFRLPLFALLTCAVLPLHGETFPGEEGKKKKTSTVAQEGWLKKTGKALWPFGKKAGQAEMAPPPKGSQVGKEWKQLVPSISIDPLPLKLSDVRSFKVTLQLANKGKKLAQLDFPTTQRIEVLVKDATGKTIEQWSEDHAFENEPTLVAINPSERLEYVATIATRDMQAGQTYTVEGFFPNFDQLRASKVVIPLP